MGKQDINNPLRDYVLTFFKTKLFNLASIKDSSVVLFEKKLNVTSNTPLDLVGKSLLDFKLFLLPNDFSVNKFPNKNFNKNYNFFFLMKPLQDLLLIPLILNLSLKNYRYNYVL
jgi:hypothetical protein